jgi:tRNA(Ile)-lysidine synthase
MTVDEVRELVSTGGLLPAERVVVAMLSGGRDSVCLLDVAVALCGAKQVRALHVNYGLRVESDGDEVHCREMCERLGVQIEVVRASREPGASGNLHAWAREVRYGAARELVDRLDTGMGVVSEEGGSRARDGGTRARAGTREDEGACMATGHTATDQVETILYRLAASPGRRALLGMPATEGRLVRPLLGISREQTAAYCVERGLAWREDASNENPDYARSRVRHRLLQALDAVHPAARANVLRTAALLREETELLDTLVTAELDGRAGIAIDRLRELPPALARLVVIRLAEDAAGTFVPQAGERVGELIALGRRGGRVELHVGGHASAVIEDGELRMIHIRSRPQRPSHLPRA